MKTLSTYHLSRRQLLLLMGAVSLFSTAIPQTYRETKLVAPDGVELDQFGATVAISGEWAAVGAPGRDDRGENSGALYMFRKSNGRWRFSQKLLASDGAAGDALAGVSMDGEHLAASATRALYNGARSGVVYLFKRMDTTWIQMRKVGPDPAVSDALFGISTSLKGVNLLVGAFLDREIGTQTGAAYVFTRTGEDWVQQARLLASDRRHLHNFGYTVSLFDSLALVGAPYDSNRNGTLAGAAYLFQRMGSSWHEKSKLIATDGLPDDLAGFVAIEAGHLIVCAPQSILVSRPGVAYAFTASSKHRQTFSARDGINRNAFGVTLSLRSDRLIVKASGDTSRGPGTGAAYLFLFKDSVWVQKHKFTASDGAAGANYGECAMDDSSIIIGALNARGTFSEQGAAYIYEPIVLSVHDVDHESREFMLHQNFPNPFNPSTEIRWKIPDVRLVRLNVFDILGREVAVLVNEVKDGGTHSVSFDAGDLPSGVYYCRLVAGASRQTRKMVFIK